MAVVTTCTTHSETDAPSPPDAFTSSLPNTLPPSPQQQTLTPFYYLPLTHKCSSSFNSSVCAAAADDVVTGAAATGGGGGGDGGRGESKNEQRFGGPVDKFGGVELPQLKLDRVSPSRIYYPGQSYETDDLAPRKIKPDSGGGEKKKGWRLTLLIHIWW